MRQARLGGWCADCGREGREGLYWENALVVLDLGVPGMPPLEPDTSPPVLCDACEGRRREAESAAAKGGRA